MSETVELRFKYTEDEYVSAMRRYFARALYTKTDIVAGVAAVIAGILFLIYSENSFVWDFLIFAGVILLLINFVAYFIAPRLRFRREPKLHNEYFLKFSEDGIVFKTAGIDSNLQWSLYDKVWATDKFYFLFYGRNTFTVIPKRAFDSREQEEVFKSMLRRKISLDMN